VYLPLCPSFRMKVWRVEHLKAHVMCVPWDDTVNAVKPETTSLMLSKRQIKRQTLHWFKTGNPTTKVRKQWARRCRWVDICRMQHYFRLCGDKERNTGNVGTVMLFRASGLSVCLSVCPLIIHSILSAGNPCNRAHWGELQISRFRKSRGPNPIDVSIVTFHTVRR
jgi:hypothetical protein